MFQRFCLLLLIIHGELERVQQDKTDEFLKKLNVYSEVVTIKQTISDCKFQPQEITALYQDDEQSNKNKLQQFINVVVTYAVLKVKAHREDAASAKQSQRVSQTNGKRNDYLSDSQSMHSHFSQITTRTANTQYVPVLRSSSKGSGIGVASVKEAKQAKCSPAKRKFSEITIN